MKTREYYLDYMIKNPDKIAEAIEDVLNENEMFWSFMDLLKELRLKQRQNVTDKTLEMKVDLALELFQTKERVIQ